jgi:transposase InsO family protein
LGPKGLKRELKRLHGFTFSTSTIWKVLHRNNVSALRSGKRPKKPKRYNRPVPGDRVQVDTCKIGKNLYQFTAIDDCTRLRVLGLYDARSAKNAVQFLREQMLKEFPFPIQRVQTDRGSEFVGFEFQDALRERKIKFRPNRPAAPHLNGKVEKSQRTDRMEFWATVDRSVGREALGPALSEWQRFYNEERSHSSLGEKTPAARLAEVRLQVPTLETVEAAYDPKKEVYITNSHYSWQPA